MAQIKVIRSDGKEIVVALPKMSAVTATTAQAPLRMRPLAPAEKKTDNLVVPAVTVGQLAGIRPNIARSQNTGISSIPSTSGHVRQPPPALLNRGQQQLGPAIPNAPGVIQRPFALGRSRLLPAMVPSSSLRQPTTLLPSSSSSLLPKRSRLVHFNPNVGISEKVAPSLASSSYLPSRPGNGQLYHRYSADHERNMGTRFVADTGLGLVGPMRPLSAPRVPAPPYSIPQPPTRLPLVVGDAANAVEDDDEEELGLAETYSEYVPAKCKFLDLLFLFKGTFFFFQ